MKILLDENLPRKLKLGFSATHDLFTVGEMNWLGQRNGDLLALMTLNGFDALITIDKNLRYQQNLDRFPIRLFVLNAPNNRLDTLEPYIAKLSQVVNCEPTTTVVTIDAD